MGSKKSHNEGPRPRGIRLDYVGNCFVMVMLSGFMVLLLGVLVYWTFAVYMVIRIKTVYVPSAARMTHSELLRHEREDRRSSTTWSARFRYAYVVNGRAYEGRQYGGVVGGSSDQRYWQRAVSSHPVGGEVTIYYDPAAPGKSVMTKHLAGGDIGFLGFVPAFFLVFGCITRWGFRRRRQSFTQWMRGPLRVKSDRPLLLLPIGLAAIGLGIYVVLNNPRPPGDPHPYMVYGPWVVLLMCVPLGIGLIGIGAVKFIQVHRKGRRKKRR